MGLMGLDGTWNLMGLMGLDGIGEAGQMGFDRTWIRWVDGPLTASDSGNSIELMG